MHVAEQLSRAGTRYSCILFPGFFFRGNVFLFFFIITLEVTVE